MDMNKRLIPVAVVWGLILLTLWIGYQYLYVILANASYAPRPIAPRASLTEEENSAIEVFNRFSPSVAFIMTEAGGGLSSLLGSREVRIGAGSGFVWDTQGHIVTNFHVIEGAEVIGVQFGSDELLHAKVVGAAPDYDLAVIRLEGPPREFQPLPLGESKNLQIGQIVYAIGNPFGLTRTMTQGIVSALNRSLPTESQREIKGVIQTDAAINPGNSGGPLLDSAGRLIGVTSAIVSQTGNFSGVGFAVPVDIVNQIVPELIKTGRVPRPGIGIAALPEEVSARLGIQGVVIVQVIPGSPAAKAGLRPADLATARIGDVIVAIDGHRVHSIAELAAELTKIGIGNKAELTLVRDGKEHKVTLAVVDISELAAR
jgi:2-alkenal reductase